MLKSLQYFKGKVCSIFTCPINRNFREENPKTFVEQAHHYFVGVVDAVEEDGILVSQIGTGLKSFFFKQSLIAISEEEVLDPQNEEDAKIINELKKANAEMRPPVVKKKNEFVDIEDLDTVLKNIKSGA